MGQNVKNKVDKRTIAIDLKSNIVHQVNSLISVVFSQLFYKLDFNNTNKYYIIPEPKIFHIYF